MCALSLQPPSSFVPGNSPADEWTRWRRRFEIYVAATGLSQKPVSQQRAILLHVLGDTALNIYATFGLSETDTSPTIDDIFAAFDAHYRPFRNTTFKRNVFFTADQGPSQTFDEYVTELKTMSADCEFGDLADSLIRDRLVIGSRDRSLRERMLQDPELTLAKAIDLGRAAERSQTQLKNIDKEDANINFMKSQSKSGQLKYNAGFKTDKMNINKGTFMQKGTSNIQKGSSNNCRRCGTKHPPMQCPAYGRTCYKCKRHNHFAVMCRQKKIHDLAEEEHIDISEETSEHTLLLDTLTVHTVCTPSKEWTHQILIYGNLVNLKLDTGSQVNILTTNELKQWTQRPKMQPTTITVVSYTGQKVPIVGQCTLSCKCESNSKKGNLTFLIADLKAPSVLGLAACVQLGLICKIDNMEATLPTPLCDRSVEDIIDEYSDVFEGLGELPGHYKIVLKDGAIPCIQAPRHVPAALRESVKEELNRMEKLGIIEKITEPTDWVHPMVVVKKPNGSVRICLDPRKLNTWIKREHYKLPSPEEVLARIPQASYYTVLDAQSAFWQIKVDEESSKLLTMATEFGRYRFLRLPYGVCSAPEVFQQKMHELYLDVEKTETYMDDVLTAGVTSRDHNIQLIRILDIARKNNLKFEKSKLQLKKTNVKFVGHRVSREGILIDPDKVVAMTSLKAPTDKKSLQRFLGTITYVARFIPGLSEKTAYLRQLLRNDVPWKWESVAQTQFENLIELATKPPVLRHFVPKEEITLSVDASQHGLGAVITQKGAPVAYASAALTDTQVRYSQIEKELLAILYGCQRFHYYLYCRSFTAQTDHKPLLTILKKPLDNLSPRLQRLVIKLQRYDFVLEYVPGRELKTADMLSRDSKPVDVVNTDDLESDVLVMELRVTATSSKLTELAQSTAEDPELRLLTEVIEQGWPNHLKELPVTIRHYWHCRDELHKIQGLICRGQRVVVPSCQRRYVLQRIHAAHQGMTSCKAVARECFYWPGMNSNIEETVSQCQVCQRYQRAQMHEPLLQYPVPELPWQRVAADIFYQNGEKYLLLLDYYSKYPEVSKLASTSADHVIPTMKAVFARHGVPATLLTDNGPPFSSRAFQEFVEAWGFEHTTTSPYHAQSNGLVERMVQTIKNLFQKAKADNKDPYLSLLALRATPGNNLPSPSQLLMGRRIRTLLPFMGTLHEPVLVDKQQVQKSLQSNQDRQAFYYNRKARPLPPLIPGQQITMNTAQGWLPATIVREMPQPRSYLVNQSGTHYRRNRCHLREQRYYTPESTRKPTTIADNQEKSQPSNLDPLVSPTMCDSSVDCPGETVPNVRTTRSGRVVRPPKRYPE